MKLLQMIVSGMMLRNWSENRVGDGHESGIGYGFLYGSLDVVVGANAYQAEIYQ